MTGRRARVGVRLPGFWQELPVVCAGAQRELEHAVRRVLVRLAVRVERRAEPRKERPAGPDDELPHTVGVVEMPAVVLRCEALVVVTVAAQQDLDACAVEVRPHRLHEGVVAVVPRAVAACGPIAHLALPRWRGEFVANRCPRGRPRAPPADLIAL